MSARLAEQWVAQLAALGVAAALATGALAQTPPDFAWRLPLATPGDAAYYRFDVPAAVYEGALRGDLADVRIFNGDGSTVPMAFVAPTEASRQPLAEVDLPFYALNVDTQARDLGNLTLKLRQSASGTSVDVSTRTGAAVRGARVAGYLVDATGLTAPLVGLRVPLPAGANVVTSLRVDGSDDLAAWRPLALGATLLASETKSGQRLAHERVALSGIPVKYLRITFAQGQPAPPLSGIFGEFADRRIDAPRQWREAAGVADKDHPGDFDFDLGGRFPVDRVTLALPQINTVAPAQLFARTDPQDAWRLVGRAQFYRLRRDGSEWVAPPAIVDRTASRYWRLSIDPKSGGIGTNAPTLSAGWLPRSIVFAARGNGPFELAYGSAQATSVALPIEILVPDYDRRRSPADFATASVGVSAAPPALAALRTPIDFKRWLLWAALALATIMLGWMAIRLSREMSAAPAKAPDDAAPGPRSGV